MISIPYTLKKVVLEKLSPYEARGRKLRLKLPLLNTESNCREVVVHVDVDGEEVTQVKTVLAPGVNMVVISFNYPVAETGSFTIRVTTLTGAEIYRLTLPLVKTSRYEINFNNGLLIIDEVSGDWVGVVEVEEVFDTYPHVKKVRISIPSEKGHLWYWYLASCLLNNLYFNPVIILRREIVKSRYVLKLVEEGFEREYSTYVGSVSESPSVLLDNMYSRVFTYFGSELSRYRPRLAVLEVTYTGVRTGFSSSFEIIFEISYVENLEPDVEKVCQTVEIEFNGFVYESNPPPPLHCISREVKVVALEEPPHEINIDVPYRREEYGEVKPVVIRLVPVELWLNSGPYPYIGARRFYCIDYNWVTYAKLREFNAIEVDESKLVNSVLLNGSTLQKFYLGQFVDEVKIVLNVRAGVDKGVVKVMIPIKVNGFENTGIKYRVFVNDKYVGDVISWTFREYAKLKITWIEYIPGEIGDVKAYVNAVDVTERPIVDVHHLLEVTLVNLEVGRRYRLVLESWFWGGELACIWSGEKLVSKYVTEFIADDVVKKLQFYIYFTAKERTPGEYVVSTLLIRLYGLGEGGAWILLDSKLWPSKCRSFDYCVLSSEDLTFMAHGEIKPIINVVYRGEVVKDVVYVKSGESIDVQGYVAMFFKEPLKEQVINISLIQEFTDGSRRTVFTTRLNVTRSCYKREEHYEVCEIDKTVDNTSISLRSYSDGKSYTLTYISFVTKNIVVDKEFKIYAEVNGVRSNEVHVVPTTSIVYLSLGKTEVVKGETIPVKVKVM